MKSLSGELAEIVSIKSDKAELNRTYAANVNEYYFPSTP